MTTSEPAVMLGRGLVAAGAPKLQDAIDAQRWAADDLRGQFRGSDVDLWRALCHDHARAILEALTPAMKKELAPKVQAMMREMGIVP